MPRLNHLAVICEKQKKINSVPLVEDGAKREGVAL